ncbi:MAG: protein kinase [Gemmataceae bacterium]
MPIPTPLLKCCARGLIRGAGWWVAGQIGAVLAGGVFEEIWEYWQSQTDSPARIQEIQTLAQANPTEVRAEVSRVVSEEAGGLPEDLRLQLEVYLSQIPATIRRTLRRPSDPSGTTIPPGLVLSKADDLLPFLPPRLPRFKPGDRPLAGVDWQLAELLGVGGFGEVWKATNPHFDGVPPVALKFCLDGAARDYLLRHEATVLNQVMRQGHHDGIIALRHTYLSADPPCLEYEYISGGDLAGLIQEWHRSGQPPTPSRPAS